MVMHMKKILVLILALLVITTFSSSTGLAGSGDENYNGEDDEQPGEGVTNNDDNPGDTKAQDSPGDRTRFKDR
ncbi:MAG: hypothetical protein A4E24_00027 [Methanomethylovorans sp. PtaU1.Bin093]|nr:MAG: hypothetical protein A4E24_00027 [Methanomethylovorans sp. PtaU1.Bin093]